MGKYLYEDSEASEAYDRSNPNLRSVNWKRVFRIIEVVFVVFTAFSFWSMVVGTVLWLVNDTEADILSLQEDIREGVGPSGGASKQDCNVTGINVHGPIVTYIENESRDDISTASEDVIYAIKYAEEEKNIKAIFLDIDSYGGYPIAAEEIARALRDAEKPTVALIRGAGTSAAYWIATGADTIFASKLSDVGGMGVTISYLENAAHNAKEGFTYQSLSTGKYKDMGDPDRPLSAEEKAMLMRDIRIAHEILVANVARNRGLDVATVAKLADGSTMLGEAALANKLIDRIGGYPEAEAYLKEKVGAEPKICW